MDSNQCDLHIIKQVSADATPDTSMTKVRFVSESMAGKFNRKASDEIRADGQISDVVDLSAEQSGGFAFELSASDSPDTIFNDLLQSVLFSVAWSTPLAAITALSDLVVDASAKTITTIAGSFTGLTAGKYVKISGFTDQSGGTGVDATGNNGYFRLAEVAAKVLTLVETPVAVATAQDTVTITDGSHVANGQKDASTFLRTLWTIERSHLLTGDDAYFAWQNCVASQLNLSIKANSEITGQFDFMGGTQLAISSTSICAGNTPVAANTNSVINATSNVGTIKEGGVSAAGVYIQSLDLSIGMNVRSIPAVGSLWPATTGTGSLNVSGSLSVLFTSKTLYEKYVNNTASSLLIPLTDAEGNVYLITIGRIKFNDADINVSGKDTDVPVNLQFIGTRETTFDNTIQVDYFPVA